MRRSADFFTGVLLIFLVLGLAGSSFGKIRSSFTHEVRTDATELADGLKEGAEGFASGIKEGVDGLAEGIREGVADLAGK